MSLPAAAAPLAVLVLAWDETTPAARVLVEPTDFPVPTLDSVAVLIPTSPPGDTLTQEEFLPLPVSPAPALPAEAPASPTHPEASGSAAEAAEPTEAQEAAASQHNTHTPKQATASEAAAAGAVAADSLPEVALPAAADTSTPPLPTAEATTAAALVGPALVWQQVRVLHFASPAPPTLVWEGSANAPAAPYLGNSVAVAAALETSEAQGSAVAAALLAGAGSAASALSALHGPELSGSAPATVLAAALPPAYLLAELPAAPDAESDATPAPGPDEPVLTPDALITELSEAAASPADGLTVDASAVQTEPAQLAAPAEAAATTSPAAETPLLPMAESAALPASSLDALHPTGQPFNAPDLNFQIIQYARQTVPRALAEQPFGVIYAPAWPTWLAAQELRHRSGQPLLLHLAQLAAADDELIDLAAGWVAEIQRQALHRADLILTETPALAQRLRHELALPAYRVRAVPAADAAAVAQALHSAVRE